MPVPKKPRECPVCHQTFKPMTDKVWERVWYEHETMSLRHKKYVSLKSKEVVK